MDYRITKVLLFIRVVVIIICLLVCGADCDDMDMFMIKTITSILVMWACIMTTSDKEIRYLNER